MVLKISVSSAGAVLVDGRQVEPASLEEILKAAKESNATVWYHREASQAAPPPEAMQVIELIARYKLPISLSSKPDFSDYIANGVSHPRVQTDAFEPHLPHIDPSPDIEDIFAKVRAKAGGETGRRCLVLVRPDRRYLLLSLPETPDRKAAAGAMERIVSSAVKRNICVIAATGFAAAEPGAPALGLADVSKAIPFLGILAGLSYIGHAVWIFEGHRSALAAGCRDADVLIVDGGMVAFLDPGWKETVGAVMRNPNILIHDRATFQLRLVRKVGESRDRMEFHD